MKYFSYILLENLLSHSQSNDDPNDEVNDETVPKPSVKEMCRKAGALPYQVNLPIYLSLTAAISRRLEEKEQHKSVS